MTRLELAKDWHEKTKGRMARAAFGLPPGVERRKPRLLARIVWPERSVKNGAARNARAKQPTLELTDAPPPAPKVQPPSDSSLRWMMDAVRKRTPAGRADDRLRRMEAAQARSEFQELVRRQRGEQ